MKKTITILSIIFCLTGCTGITSDNTDSQLHDVEDVYEYPITSDSPEWITYATLDEKLKVTQIPSDILSTISTEGLILTVLNYPLLSHVYVYSSDDSAFDHISQQFNGIAELSSREDSGSLLLQYYGEVKDIFQLKMLDLLLNSPNIQTMLTDNEKQQFEKLHTSYLLKTQAIGGAK